MVVSKLVYKDYYTKISILYYFAKVFKFFHKLIFMTKYLAQYGVERMLYDFGQYHLSHEKEVDVFLFEAENNDQANQRAEDYRLEQLRKNFLPGSLMILDRLLEVKEIELKK